MSETLEILAEYPWPGNVRELENSLESAVVLAKGETIRPEDLPGKIREKIPTPIVSETSALTPPLEEIEKSYIFWVLNQTGWNKSKAASILGIDNSTLYRKIERYGLKENEEKQKDYTWGILAFIFIGSLVVYWMTSARSVFWWDSGELIASVSSLGIAHRPGFPIYILLAKMFSFLPFGTITFKVNLFPACWRLYH